MSMKRCFELSAGPSFSAVSRALIVGGVLSLAVACARKTQRRAIARPLRPTPPTSSTAAMAPPRNAGRERVDG